MEKKQITFKAGWPGYLLSAAIVAGRAWSSPAPMESWSWWSWLLMMAPAFFPLYFFAAWCVLYAGGWIFLGVLWLAGIFRRGERR